MLIHPVRRCSPQILGLLLSTLVALPAFASQGLDPSSALENEPLPWERQPEKEEAGPNEIHGPRALLDLFGIDASHRANLRDGEAPGPNDEETLVDILFRLPQFPRDAEQKWAHPLPAGTTLIDAPESHRLDMFTTKGQATGVEVVHLDPEVAEWCEFAEYFRVTIEIDGASRTAVVCTRSVPKAWPVGKPIREPCRFAGLFFKVGATGSEGPELVFVASRVAWSPNRVNEAMGIAPDQVYLSSLGMDIGRFDDVRERNRKPLGLQDRDCFYELLAAVGRADAAEFRSRANHPLNLEQLLATPSAAQGKLLSVQGLARRVTRITISEEVETKRLGFDHYFQIDLFIPLGDKVVRLGKSTPTEEAPTFTNSFPVTACVRRLPEGFPKGPDIREEIRVSGVYFKLWSYHTEFISAYDKRQMQLAPMLVGIEPEIVRPDRTSSPLFGLAAGLGAVAVLAGIWFGLWRWSRSDRSVSLAVPRQSIGPPPQQSPSLSDTDDESAGKGK